MPMSKTMDSPVSMDANPLSPHTPTFSLDVSVDAFAGPQDARRRTTQELKQEAREADNRRAQHSMESLPLKQSLSRDELNQVESEIRRRVDNLEICKQNDSSYSSLSSTDSIGCSSMPSANWEDELRQYQDFMPPKLRVEYIDVLILYCEEDRVEAQKFQTHLREEITVPNGPIETLLYDDAEMQAISGSKIGHLEKVVQRSTYVFIFMTKNFIEDKWCEFSSESCLMEAITNPAKQWCVVPVYTEKRNTSFRVPMGLNTLKGINYYNNDRFYKNGVARLIGDKIYVRIKANEEHKIKQKEWLEQYKREQARLREHQRRTEETQKAMTQQLLDWLDKETRELIRNGILPNYLPHSNSESDISSHESSLSHSASTNSLKPIHEQNPAVAAYYQNLLAQYKMYNGNIRNYNPQQMAIIDRVYGGPQTPTLSPQVMNAYLNPGQFGGRPGDGNYFPPVSRSVSYDQTNHLVKRSTSQASADMAPSAEFILHTETGNIPVSVPSVLFERIKGEPKDKQQEFVKMYFDEIRQKQLSNNAADPSIRNQHVSNPLPSHGSMSPPSNISGQGAKLPNFGVIDDSMTSARNSRPLCTYSDRSSTLQSGISSGVSSQYSDQLGSNVDGNRSNFQGGNVPYVSMIEQDAGTSLDSRGNQSMPSRLGQGNKTEKSKVTETQSDSESEDETQKSKKTNKGKGTKVVHIHKTYIYQPGNVQIGDGNVVNEQSTENENSEGEGEERVIVSRDSELSYTDNKTMQTGKPSNSSEEKLKMKKVEIEPGSETHGEMQEQPGSSGASSSCNVDAAPSTVNKLSSSQFVTRKKQTSVALKINEEEIEEAHEVFPDDKKNAVELQSGKMFENSSKFDESCEHVRNEKNSQFDNSVNLNSSSSEKSGSLKNKKMPTGDSSPVVPVKPIGVARPVAAVSPFAPKDDSDDNCDNTDPKTVIKSKSSNSNTVSTHLADSEQTFVKVAHSEFNNTPPVNNLQQTELLGSNSCAQVLTKMRDLNNSANGPFSRAKLTDPKTLFYRPNALPLRNEEENSGTRRHEVAIGNDPLSRENEEDPSHSSSPYKPLDDDGDDLEFDMLNESGNHESASYPNQGSFEESGTKSNKTWNRKGSSNNSSKKECVIS